jgi:hypothetical protein
MKPCHSSVRSVTILTVALVFWVAVISKVQADDDLARFQDLAAAAGNASGTAQVKLWKQFLSESSSFAKENTDNLEIWMLRATAAIACNDAGAGKEAAERLVALNAMDSQDQTLRRLMAGLLVKGWLSNATPGTTSAATSGPTREETVSYLTGLLKRAGIEETKDDPEYNDLTHEITTSYEWVGYDSDTNTCTIQQTAKRTSSKGSSYEVELTTYKIPLANISGVQTSKSAAYIDTQSDQISRHWERTGYTKMGSVRDRKAEDEQVDHVTIHFYDSVDAERAKKAFTHLVELARGPELFDK